MPNHLSGSSSPYLLQHADNPVDWYPWGTQALDKARLKDKPIFLSIGYAACHWCHVMAHESFEDPDVAALMNANFINIKVDREERPDLDSIYMSFVVALTNQGGWPMSVFLTPDGKPFYAGTYFPPTPSHNLPAFREVLEAVARLWKEDRERLLTGSEGLVAKLQARPPIQPGAAKLDLELLKLLARSLTLGYDWKNGGWGGAPKFPQPMLVEFLLRQGSRGDQSAIDQAVHTLRAMAQGGMYDTLGGGFARYSVDNSWQVPHFEKMLYDNAQLALVYLHAYQVTGEVSFEKVCESTLDFVLRELTDPLGGFYSSLDADSEGEEGKFYLWTLGEIKSALPEPAEADLFIAAYKITADGNFDGRNILRQHLSDEQLANQFLMEGSKVQSTLATLRAGLLAARRRRVRPSTDDKVLTSWNAMMMAAFAEASRALDRQDYLQAATRNADFLLENLVTDGKLRRSWRDGKAVHNAYLEDYAGFALALLSLYRADPNSRWYAAAIQLLEQMLDHFADPVGGFFDTSDDHESLLYRPKEIQDNATPSGNSLAALLLLQLAAYEGRAEWHTMAEHMIAMNMELIKRYPTAFGQWLNAIDLAVGPVQEVAIVGDLANPATKSLIVPLLHVYHPRLVLAASPFSPTFGSPALLNDRPLMDNRPTAYVCQNFVCQQPVSSAEELLKQLI